MHVRIYRVTLIIVREIIVIKYRKLHFRAQFSLPWHVSRKLDTNMCDFNIAFCDGENPFERGARTASKAFFRDPPFKRGSAGPIQNAPIQNSLSWHATYSVQLRAFSAPALVHFTSFEAYHG